MANLNVNFGAVSAENINKVDPKSGEIILAKDSGKLVYNVGENKQVIDTCNLDTIDCVYSEEVQSPYIKHKDFIFTDFQFDGPYGITSIQDILNVFKYAEKNTDLLRIELDTLDVVLQDNTQLSILDILGHKFVSYGSGINEGFDKGLEGQELFNALQKIQNDEQLDNVVASSISLQDDCCIAYGFTSKDGEVFAICLTDRSTFQVTSYTNKLLDETQGDINILITDIICKGRVYVEHYEGVIKNLFESGKYVISDNSSINSCYDINLNPQLVLIDPANYFTVSGEYIYTNESALGIVPNSFYPYLQFANNLFPENVSEDKKYRSIPYLVTGGNDFSEQLSTKLLGELKNEQYLENPEYKALLGYELVYDGIIDDMKYNIDEADYGKYDYYGVVYPNEAGYMPSGNGVQATIQELHTETSHSIYVGNGGGSFDSGHYATFEIIQHNMMLHLNGLELFNFFTSGFNYDYNHFGGLFVKSITAYDTANKGCTLKLYRKKIG